MKKLVGLAALCGAMACGAETLAFIGDSDKNPVAYALNETITFNVKLVDKDTGNAIVPGKELRWTLSGDDSSLNKSGTASSDSPLTVTTAIREPGFVRLTVKAYENNFMYYRVPTIVNKDVIVMEATSNVGHQGDIYSTDGHEFTVRKTGTGHRAHSLCRPGRPM